MNAADFGLTNRQLDILQGLADGEPIGLIAARLRIAHTTVTNEMNKARDALDTKTKTHAVAAAMRKGFID